MDRRKFLTGLASASLAGLFLPKYAKAVLNCLPFLPSGVQQCEAGINSAIAHITAAKVGGQHLTQWCWAACIQMVFQYYGFHLPQEEIVRQTWGSIVNLPAYPAQILAELNRSWVDSKGRAFGVLGDSYTAKPVTAALDLSQDMPLIIVTTGHAMVLTGLRYTRDVSGNGHVTAAIVRDPWPGRDRRVLSAEEWFNTILLIRIRLFPL
jgi:ABC-type bacteriocin/lantibiotic exporter with double-glycine peptidase domain